MELPQDRVQWRVWVSGVKSWSSGSYWHKKVKLSRRSTERGFPPETEEEWKRWTKKKQPLPRLIYLGKARILLSLSPLLRRGDKLISLSFPWWIGFLPRQQTSLACRFRWTRFLCDVLVTWFISLVMFHFPSKTWLVAHWPNHSVGTSPQVPMTIILFMLEVKCLATSGMDATHFLHE
jgi:hypothetical protein